MADSNGVSKTNYKEKQTVNTPYYTWAGLDNGTACYFVLTSENSLNEESPESDEISGTSNAQQNYYIFPESGPNKGPTDVTIIGKNFQETPMISLYGGGPYIKGSCDTPDNAYGVYVSGNYAYVADGGLGLQVIEKYKPLNDITYHDPYIIKATIPAGYRPGTYNLHITNPDGEHTILNNAFTVYHLP